MAGDWIMMRVNLGEDEAVYSLAATLGLDAFAVVGRLHKLWAWADQHTEDGVVRKLSAAWMDEYVKAPGFFDAICETKWVNRLPDGGFQFVNFDTWNGANAKKRQKDNRRKANDRKKLSVSEKCPQNVRDLSAKVPEKSGRKTGPEKRREEKRISPPPTSSGGVVDSKEAEEGVSDLFQAGDSKGFKDPYWQIHKALREAGMVDSGEPLENLRIQGISQAECLKIIGWWQEQPKGAWANAVGALHHKLSNMVEGEAVEAGWPDFAPEHRAKVQAAASREAEQSKRFAEQDANAQRRREAMDSENVVATLETRFGAVLDGMGRGDLESLAAEALGDGTPAMGLFRSKGTKSNLVRPSLLKVLANRHTGPPPES